METPNNIQRSRLIVFTLVLMFILKFCQCKITLFGGTVKMGLSLEFYVDEQ